MGIIFYGLEIKNFEFLCIYVKLGFLDEIFENMLNLWLIEVVND